MRLGWRAVREGEDLPPNRIAREGYQPITPIESVCPACLNKNHLERLRCFSEIRDSCTRCGTSYPAPWAPA